MNDDRTDTRYLRQRVADSLGMAAAAASPCAQIAHMTLARLYGEAIDALIARPVRPDLHLLFADAVASGGAVANYRAVSGHTTPMIMEREESERQVVEALLL